MKENKYIQFSSEIKIVITQDEELLSLSKDFEHRSYLNIQDQIPNFVSRKRKNGTRLIKKNILFMTLVLKIDLGMSKNQYL